MATRGKRLEASVVQRIRRLKSQCGIRQIARLVGVSRNSVRKILRGTVDQYGS